MMRFSSIPIFCRLTLSLALLPFAAQFLFAQGNEQKSAESLVARIDQLSKERPPEFVKPVQPPPLPPVTGPLPTRVVQRLVMKRQIPMAENPLVDFDLSSDGGVAVVVDIVGDVHLWDLSGEPREMFHHRTISDGRMAKVAISSDGVYAAVSLDSGAVRVLEVQTGRLVHVHKSLDRRVTELGFSHDGKRVCAIDELGSSFVAPLTEDVKALPGPEMGTRKVSFHSGIATTGDSCWWRFAENGDQKIEHAFYDGKKFLNPIMINLKQPDRLFGFENGYMISDGLEYAWVAVDNEKDETSLKISYGRSGYNISDADLTSDGTRIWFCGYEGLCIQEIGGKRIHVAPFPTSEIRENKVYPDANFVASLARGRVLSFYEPEEATVEVAPPKQSQPATTLEVFNSRQISVRSQISSSIIALLRDQRFDALELLAKKWDGRNEHFTTADHASPYSFLIELASIYRLHEERAEDRNARYLKWIEENPDNCQFTRLALAHVYMCDAYRARGQGYANTVTEEGWKVFFENMAQMWKIIEPIYDDEHVPAEAYTYAIIAGKNLQWDRAEVSEYLKKSYAAYPTYHRPFVEESVARLERWGGQPGDTAEFAEKLANMIGGDEGDIMYAEITRHIQRYFGARNVADATGLSPQRATRGLILIAKRDQNPIVMLIALMYSGVYELDEEANEAARQLAEWHVVPPSEIWPDKYPTVDKAVEAAGIPRPDAAKTE